MRTRRRQIHKIQTNQQKHKKETAQQHKHEHHESLNNKKKREEHNHSTKKEITTDNDTRMITPIVQKREGDKNETNTICNTANTQTVNT